MGYCYISGEKVNGKWKFRKCDGRNEIDFPSSKCGGGDPGYYTSKSGKSVEIARCYGCIQYCKTYKSAVDALEDWYKIHPEERK
jgi:hypothetical protein